MNYRILFVLLLLKSQSLADADKEYAFLPEIFYHDNYDTCMYLGDETLYCSINYVLEPLNKDNPPEIWTRIQNLSAIETNYRYDHLRHCICVPKTCPGVIKSDENDPLFKKALEECYNEKFRDIELKGSISEMQCQTNNPKNPLDWLDVVCGTLFVIYILFVFYATYFDGVARYKTPKENEKLTRGPFLLSFSLITNWYRLTTVKRTPEVDKLRSIQGIRFYNSAIVVLAHTLLGFLASPISNTRYAEKTFEQKGSSIFFAAGHLCMTTFFFISSFLLSNGLFNYMKDKKRFSLKFMVWILFYRLFRLIPTLVVVILFHATWFRHLGDGPYWNVLSERDFENCRKNGWTNLLFINNIVDVDNMCLPTTWFLARNIQYFVLSLLFISLLKKHEKCIWYILGGAMSLNIFATFLQNYYYDFSSLMLLPIERYIGLKKFLASSEFKTQLGGFFGNLAGIIVGIAFGYYFNKHQTENPDKKIFNTKFRIYIFWMISSQILTCILIPGLVIFYYSNEHDAFWASAYAALSRPIFAISLGTIILGFAEGLGSIALKICTWPPLYVLGRLTYSVYLSHMSVVMLKPAMSRYPTYISQAFLMSRFLGDMVVVYIVAILLTLFLELPTSALQKVVFVQRHEDKENKENDIKND